MTEDHQTPPRLISLKGRKAILDAIKSHRAKRQSASTDTSAVSLLLLATRFPNAVLRNRARRRVKEAFRRQISQGDRGRLYVFRVTPRHATLDWNELFQEVERYRKTWMTRKTQ